ncbi:MAG: glutamine-hydrolyzing GMP synthase, partial [Oscillospiraceae bacterium]|nr:glutamine-hydrolyzing GMP synthase [Oscillospiraceae bacterium]
MEKILVLDFGGQYDQLIARRVREQHVYAEIRQYDAFSPSEIKKEGYRGIIFTGGPNSVYDPSSPRCDPSVLESGVPVLGICYGAQLLAYMCGGEVAEAENGGEYGKTLLKTEPHVLFRDVPAESVCWMSHTDRIRTAPAGFRITAATDKCPCAAMCRDDKKLYAVQFHPEVVHTRFGSRIIRNFLFDICGCKGDWSAPDHARELIEKYRSGLSGKKVLLALSGGVDSSVAALLLHKAVGR